MATKSIVGANGRAVVTELETGFSEVFWMDFRVGYGGMLSSPMSLKTGGSFGFCLNILKPNHSVLVVNHWVEGECENWVVAPNMSYVIRVEGWGGSFNLCKFSPWWIKWVRNEPISPVGVE